MKMINGQSHPEQYDVKIAAMKKISKKPKLKDKENHMYTFDRFYRYHVAMFNEFGTRKCFPYAEVLWGLA